MVRFSFYKYKRSTPRRIIQLLRSLGYTCIVDPIYLRHLGDRYYDYYHNSYIFDDRRSDYRVHAFVKPLKSGYRHVLVVCEKENPGYEKFFVFDTSVEKVQTPHYASYTRLDHHNVIATVKQVVDPRKRGCNPFKIPQYRSVSFSHWRYFKKVLFKK